MSLVCRGIRGATTADANTSEAILAATREMFESMVAANGIEAESVAAIFLTTTPDLNVEFPAAAVRQMGWDQAPMLCGHEMTVPGALPMCIRALALVNTTKSLEEIVHVYLRGAVHLREPAFSDRSSPGQSGSDYASTPGTARSDERS